MPERHILSLGAVADRGWILENPSVPNAQEGGGRAKMLKKLCFHIKKTILIVFDEKGNFLKMGSSKMWDARPGFVTKSHNCVKCSFLKMGSSKMWDARPRFCPTGTQFGLKTLKMDSFWPKNAKNGFMLA